MPLWQDAGEGLNHVRFYFSQHLFGIGGFHQFCEDILYFRAFDHAVIWIPDFNQFLDCRALLLDMVKQRRGSGEIERHMFYDHPLLILNKLTGGG